MSKLIKLFKKYSLNKNGLILNISDIKSIDELINKKYKLSIITDDINKYDEYKYMNVISNSIFNIRIYNNQFDLVCFDELLQYYSDKDIIKILKFSISAGEAVLFDIPVSNLLKDNHQENIRYLKRNYWLKLFNKLNTVIIEEVTYRKGLFEKHKIFVIRKR